MSRMKQKNDWLKKNTGVDIETLLGQQIEELNKEARDMNLLQKDVDETVVTSVETILEVVQPVTTETVVATIEVVTKESGDFLTKEEAATTFTELLTPILLENEALRKELSDLKLEIISIGEKIANVQKESQEQVDTNIPVASLTAIVKQRLLKELNSDINPFRSAVNDDKTKELINQKPAVKVESEQPKHAMAGLLDNN